MIILVRIPSRFDRTVIARCVLARRTCSASECVICSKLLLFTSSIYTPTSTTHTHRLIKYQTPAQRRKARIPRHRHRLARHAFIRTSDTRDFLKLFLWKAERGSRPTRRDPREYPRRRAPLDTVIPARMSRGWYENATRKTAVVEFKFNNSPCRIAQGSGGPCAIPHMIIIILL